MKPQHPESALLGDLLQSVSRSFYLTLSTLPADLREPIGLAYLLARASDTIADTEALALSGRLDALERFIRRTDGEVRSWDGAFEVTGEAVSPGELALMGRLEEAFGVLERMHPSAQEEIRRVLRTIVSGQRSDLERFELPGDTGGVRAVETERALDTYLYQVAGVVGEFWTRLCGPERLGCPEDALQERIKLGVRYGKGLQLINILRDMRADWQKGRVYLPLDVLDARGVAVEALAQPESWDGWRDYYETLLRRANNYLDDGWYYVSQIPLPQRRLRLATALPALIGRDTLRRMAGRWPFDPRPVKVSRAKVYERLAQTLVGVAVPLAWRGMWRQR